MDANSAAAATLSGRIGDIVTGKSTVPGFETYLNSTRSWLPATFPEYGTNEPVMTYGKIDEGGGTRIDYVGLTENIYFSRAQRKLGIPLLCRTLVLTTSLRLSELIYQYMRRVL